MRLAWFYLVTGPTVGLSVHVRPQGRCCGAGRRWGRSDRRGGLSCGHENLEFATDVGAAGLKDELCHALVGEGAESFANFVGRSAHRDGFQHAVTARVPRRLVCGVQADAVLLMDDEVPFLRVTP